MKKAETSKKRRVAAFKRSKKRSDRAKKSALLKPERRRQFERTLDELKYKENKWIQKIMDSRVIPE